MTNSSTEKHADLNYQVELKTIIDCEGMRWKRIRLNLKEPMALRLTLTSEQEQE